MCRMSRAVYTIVAVLAGMALAGCGPAGTPARAEPVAPPAAAVPAAEVRAVSGPEQETAVSGPTHGPDALDRLKAQLDEIAAEQVDAPPTMGPGPEAAPSETAGDDVHQLRADVQDLRREVARLQETVDAALAYLVGELGDENRRLKKDLAPPDELEPEDPAPSAPETPAVPALPPVDYGKDGYLAIKEWGRTPEQAKELGGDVASLRGMICAVAPGASDEELKAIGKTLRSACAQYDNANIDVFDDEAAARDYAERNVRSSAHFVMNITRHKATGRDVTVIVRDDGAREIAVD